MRPAVLVLLLVLVGSVPAQDKKPLKLDWTKVPMLGDKDALKKNVKLIAFYGGKDVLLEKVRLESVRVADKAKLVTGRAYTTRKVANAGLPVFVRLTFAEAVDAMVLRQLAESGKYVNVVGTMAKGEATDDGVLIENAKVLPAKK